MDLACPLSPRAKDFSITSLMTGPAGLDSMLDSGTTITTSTTTTTSSNNNSNSDNSLNPLNNVLSINNNNNNTKDPSSSESPVHRLDPNCVFGAGSGSLGGLAGSESLSTVLGHCIASGVQTSGQGAQDCVFSSWSQQVSQYNQLSSMQGKIPLSLCL